jgi:hypothetical protein
MSIDNENGGKYKDCLFCNQPISKRSKKEFCSEDCRNYYFQAHKEDSLTKINKILKRNWEILKEVLGKNTVIEVDVLVLQVKDFNFYFLTHFGKTESGKITFYCYDISFNITGNTCIVCLEK